MLVIGLTGSIGMGKSTTAQIFRDLGVPVHDSDAAVHDIYSAGANAPIREAFPDAIEGNGLDRMKLAGLVLADAQALQKLEAIVHPLVTADRRAFLENQRKKGAEVVVCDIPLLFETGADANVDLVVVVSAPAAVQKTRVMSRNGMTMERFSAIMSKQTPDAEKRRRAHVVVDTGRGVATARRQVVALLRAIAARARAD